MKQPTPRSAPKKKEMTEWETEELVRQQTREFKREIEKRYAISKHNQAFAFPMEPSEYSNDSSLLSLENTEVYNLHNQNNILGLRKKSMSEKLLRLPDHPERNPQPKSQERQRRVETSAERVALTNRPIQLTMASNKKPTKSEHQPDQIEHSQRHQPVLYKLNIPSGSHTPVSQQRTTVDNKSTSTIQQKIQKIIQDSVLKQSERTSTAASVHQGIGTRLIDNTNTNSTLLKLLQKNGMLKQDPPAKDVSLYQNNKNIKPLGNSNRQISLRQLKSPSLNSKSYFSRNNIPVTQIKDNSQNQSNQSFHRTFTQHDSNNTSRSYISNLPQTQISTTRQQSGNKYTNQNCSTSRPLGGVKDIQIPYSPTLTNNKSFQENSYVYSNVSRLPTQNAEVIQNYIQIDNYLNQTRNYQSNTSVAKQNQERIKDHMIKIGCITGRFLRMRILLIVNPLSSCQANSTLNSSLIRMILQRRPTIRWVIDFYYLFLNIKSLLSITMFYAKNPDADKNFQIDSTQIGKNARPLSNKQANKPPASKQPPRQELNRQESLLKEAGAKALNYPQITHDILDQHLANNLVKDLGLGLVAQPQRDNQVEQYLNQHKFKGQSPQRQSGVKEGDMLTSMAQRLAKLEKLCNAQKLELKEKSEYIFELKDQLDAFKGTQGNDQMETILLENKKLKLQINEMEAFMAKYGVKWVGHEKDEKIAVKMQQLASDAAPSKIKYHYHLPKEISIDVITRRVEELNYIMEKEGATQIVKNAQGMHQLRKMDPLPIGFYKNGIAMKGFKFFPYGSNDSCQILADILDGYYPYQLKLQYPSGTLLKVIDKMDEIFQVDTNIKQVDVHSFEQRQFQPQTKDEFLEVWYLLISSGQKLPKHVIKDGKIIPIRSEIAKKFEPQPQRNLPSNARIDEEDGRTIIILTDAQKALDGGAPYDQDKMCTLKFRTETGRDTIIAVMHCQQTIAEMYTLVRGLAETPGDKLEIIQNFPRMTFEPKSTQTLEDAGLHPNAQLFFK